MPFHAAVQTPDQISEQCSRNLVKIVKIWSKELVNVVKYCKTWSKNKISSKSRSVFVVETWEVSKVSSCSIIGF